MRDFSNRLWYKKTYYRKVFSENTFRNMKIQASSITSCVFRNARFEDVDFVGCNLKKNKFTACVFKNVTFTNCNLKKTKWQGSLFEDVDFIMTNIVQCKALPESGYTERKTYPQFELDNHLQEALENFSKMKGAYKFHVLHVKQNKPNNWNLEILCQKHRNQTGEALLAISKRKDLSRLYSLGRYKKLIEKELSKWYYNGVLPRNSESCETPKETNGD